MQKKTEEMAKHIDTFAIRDKLRLRGSKTFFVFNSAKHEILNAQKYKNINKFSILQALISIESYFSGS